MQRFLDSLHLCYVGLGFSTQKEIRIRSEYGSFYFLYICVMQKDIR